MKLRKWCAWCGLGTSVCKCKNPSLLTDYSEALDWFLSLLVPVERSCGCDPQYCTCGLVWDAIDDHLEEIAALIEAERNK